MLTQKQGELLGFIHAYVTENGEAPTFDEMRDHLGLRSKSGVHRLMTALEERGHLTRTHHRARAIHRINVPKPLVGGGDGTHEDFPQVGPLMNDYAKTGLRRVPLMGAIAAGTPAAAIQERLGSMSVPADGLRAVPHYAVEVRGESMRDAGIRDGDTVIVRRQDTAEDGDVVVALLDGEEATLKRFRKDRRGITLEAANPDFPPLTLPAERVRVQGVLVSLLRSC